jgi:hypothetical protein
MEYKFNDYIYGIKLKKKYKLMIFDLIPDTNIITAHLAEAPGSFIQALIFYRENYEYIVN